MRILQIAECTILYSPVLLKQVPIKLLEHNRSKKRPLIIKNTPKKASLITQ